MNTVCDVLGISCGIFKKEIEYLIKIRRISIPFIFLDSILHMNPQKLEIEMSALIEEKLNQYEHIILVFGDCHPYINDKYDSKRVIRLTGINCCQNVLGTKEYKRLRKEGAFIVFEEWIWRWKEVFIEEIGLDEKNAPIFMGDMHRYIIYLDTGLSDIPINELEEMSAFFKLPYKIEKISLDFLAESILNVYEEICEK